MQNVTLPDAEEVGAAKAYADVLPPTLTPLGGVLGDVLQDAYAPQVSIAVLRAELAMLKAWVRALYAKHGEVCPLFGEDEK